MRWPSRGDTVVVGAQWEDSNATGVNGNESNDSATDSGAAYVFVRTGTNWSQQAYLKASNTGVSDQFFYVAVSGDTVVVGAPFENSNATGVHGDQSDNRAPDSGAAYVFVRSGTNWSQQAYLKASNTGAGDEFGWAVSVSDNTVVLGAHYEDSNGTGVNGNQSDNSASRSGAAYVFVRSGTNWNEQAYLKASSTGASDEFGGGPGLSPGTSVGVSGDTVVIGASFEDSNATGVNGDGSNNSAANSGAAYIFTGFCPSCPLLALAPGASGGYFIRFNGSLGLTYHLQRATDVTGPWDTLDTQTTPASGLIEYHDASSLPSQAFYRTVQP